MNKKKQVAFRLLHRFKTEVFKLSQSNPVWHLDAAQNILHENLAKTQNCYVSRPFDEGAQLCMVKA